MTFVHPLLLGGLLLAGIPILLHLIMRQKPKRLPFPAFRFLLDRVRTNQRKLRLRHLLLLLLRVMLVALICLALARPKLLSDGIINIGGNQPVAVALIFDTSMSMEYQSAQKGRLAEAQGRALELLDQLPEGSKIAVFDSADPGSGEWIESLSLVRERIAGLKLRPESVSVTQALGQAYRLLAELGEQETKEPWPRLLYLFSDRMSASWDASQLPHLTELRDRLFQKVKVPALFIDVGVDKPEDLAIVQVRLERQVVPANAAAKLRALVQATGREFSGEIVCRIEGKSIGRHPLKVGPGPGQEFNFEARDLKSGLYHAEIVLEPGDNLLPYNNARFATFEVIGPRQALLIADRFDDAVILKLALESKNLPNPLQCEIMTLNQAKELGLNDLSKYQAIALVGVSSPVALWERLTKYVKQGGGLAIIPGGDLDKNAYQDDLVPARFGKVVQIAKDRGLAWDESNFKAHPIMAVYKNWAQKNFNDQVQREARAYWEVEPTADGDVLARYSDGKPALIERVFDRDKDRGKVLLFTTPLDGQRHRNWNNYLESWYYVALVDLTMSYLAGTLEDRVLNHISGQPIVVPLPTAPRFQTYMLQGPQLVGQATQVVRADNASALRMPPQAVHPGHYTLFGSDGQWKTGFSLNVAPAECDLKRVPKEEIEKLLGADTVIPVEHGVQLKDQLSNHWTQPVELFPWLMVLLLFVLAVENLLANKFYRSSEQTEQSGEVK